MSTESKLPIELILRVLRYSDPRDIIRWRTVSKIFNAATHERTLWKTLYEDIPFSRPTQSVASIEHTLLKVTRLAESWTTKPMRALSTLTIDTDMPCDPPPKFISGRWLAVFESGRQFVLYDVDPGLGKHTRQVLWEQETEEVSHWDAESIVSPGEKHCMVYVLLRLHNFPDLKLLELRLNNDTGELLHAATINLPEAESSNHAPKIYAGNSYLLCIPNYGTVLDTRTDIFHKLPSVGPSLERLNWIVVSDTMLLSLHGRDGESTRVYAFTFSPDSAGDETGPSDLCFTHKGTIHTKVSHVKLMQHAVDPVTGATNIRLLDYSASLGLLGLQCVEMTLAKCSPGVVLPVNIKTRSIELPRERVRLGRYGFHRKYIDISGEGQIRGFVRARKQERRRSKRPWDTVETEPVMKFSIDTTQDPWVIVCNRIAPAEWSTELDPRKDIVFDGVRGQLCYTSPTESETLVVLDIE